MSGFVLAIDQGTTSSRAIVFDGGMRVAGLGQREFRQHYPASGWVEHDPEEIWESVLATCREAMQAAGATVLSIDAGRTLMIDGEAFTRAADAAGVAVVGRPGAGRNGSS